MKHYSINYLGKWRDLLSVVYLARARIKQFDVILTCDGKPTLRRHQLLEIIQKKGTETSFKLISFPTESISEKR